MSVIGRLDDQVEAVLINPLRRRERNNEGDAGERDAPPVLPPPPDAARREERDADETGARDEVRAALPVWLL